MDSHDDDDDDKDKDDDDHDKDDDDDDDDNRRGGWLMRNKYVRMLFNIAAKYDN